jgi:hypothetical protein
MGRRLDRLIESIRDEKGPFFMARLCLRLNFSIGPGETPDSDACEDELLDACRDLGYDAIRGRPPRVPPK